MDSLADTLQTVQFQSCERLYDSRLYSSPEEIPAPPDSISGKPGRSFEMSASDVSDFLRYHLPLCFFNVKDQSGDVLYFKVTATTKMFHVFDAYAQKKKVPKTSLRFLIDGGRIDENETPQELDLLMTHASSGPHFVAGDQIDCLLEQTGD